MPYAAQPTFHHRRWWRKKLRLLISLDFWLGIVIALIAVLGLVTLVRTIASSLAICVTGVSC